MWEFDECRGEWSTVGEIEDFWGRSQEVNERRSEELKQITKRVSDTTSIDRKSARLDRLEKRIREEREGG